MELGKRVRIVSCIFLSSILLLTLFPFYIVFADTNGSYYIGTNECTNVLVRQGEYINASVSNNNSEVRMVALNYISSGNYRTIIYAFSNSSFILRWGQNACGSSRGSDYSSQYGKYISTSDFVARWYTTYNMPSYIESDYSSIGDSQAIAYYFTYGAGAVDPEPPGPNYGDLIIEGYSTDIAGQGEASINNIDHIKWNGYIDSNGNDITNCKVRLQIIPGQYTGTSKNDLTNKTRQDFVLNPINASDSLFNANVGEVTLSWRDIVNRIDIIPYRLYSLELLGPDWQKDGWIYKLRLEDENNEYIGEWQTVYSSTSNGVQNDLIITNNTTINQTLISTIQQINSINNVDNNWIINNTEISVENNYTEPSSGQKPWWAYLLESILNTFNITNNYINNGNDGTQNIVDTVTNSDDDLNDKLQDYHDYEDDFIADMEDNLLDIEVETDIFEDNKFIASANWVAAQYTRMTNNNVIGSLIGFSLLLGLALIFIGKIR